MVVVVEEGEPHGDEVLGGGAVGGGGGGEYIFSRAEVGLVDGFCDGRRC